MTAGHNESKEENQAENRNHRSHQAFASGFECQAEDEEDSGVLLYPCEDVQSEETAHSTWLSAAGGHSHTHSHSDCSVVTRTHKRTPEP